MLACKGQDLLEELQTIEERERSRSIVKHNHFEVGSSQYVQNEALIGENPSAASLDEHELWSLEIGAVGSAVAASTVTRCVVEGGYQALPEVTKRDRRRQVR